MQTQGTGAEIGIREEVSGRNPAKTQAIIRGDWVSTRGGDELFQYRVGQNHHAATWTNLANGTGAHGKTFTANRNF